MTLCHAAWMRLPTVAFTCVAALALPAGCGNDDDDDDPTTGSPSSSTGSAWLVGDDGEMLRLTDDGRSAPYPLDTDADLHAIACVGTTAAWVVGARGTVLSTADSGQSWQHHAVDTAADLEAVAVSESAPTRVVVAGDGALLSRRGDGAFVSLSTTALPWRAVALDHEGTHMLAVTDDGGIWRADGEEPLVELARFDGQVLSAVAMAGSAEQAVVVGAEGFVARTEDGGLHWSMVEVPTVRDLWAVRTSHDGDALVAVGEAGVVVRVDASGATADEHLDPALSLRGLHIHGEGQGHTVGDAGTALRTTDFGATWDPIAVDVDTVLRGVDDIRVHGHW
jgi:photosystem II stability/assembly factor-like uncharacterized protein